MYKKAVVLAAVLLFVGGGAALPAMAGPGQQDHSVQPQIITGHYNTTNPIYPQIGAETDVVLYDLAGKIEKDYGFVSPRNAQVLGELSGDISSGSYEIVLPNRPQGTMLDFDQDASTPPGVQVFVAATTINLFGDSYIERGEGLLDSSLQFEPMTFHIRSGNIVVWAARENELFPSGFGMDGELFSDDDPLMPLPAGWSVVRLDQQPFALQRDTKINVPVVEGMGGLNDYSSLSYEDAWNGLFERTKETYPFTQEKGLDWDAIYTSINPLILAAQTDLEFHLAIAIFGAQIPDTHIGYVATDVVQAFLVGGVGISKLDVTDDGDVIITGIEPGTAASRAGMQPGDVLLMVDGLPALQMLDETPLLLSSASTSHGRRFLQKATMLQGPMGSSVALSWLGVDGSVHNDQFTRAFDVSALLTAFDAAEDDQLVIEGRLLDSGVGYISVRGFAEDVSQADSMFTQALTDLIDAGAAGIVLDVRNNTGGLVSLAMAMAGHFFPDYQRLFDFYYADGSGGFAFRGYEEILKNNPYYDGPVAVLVNEMTGSAGDMFAYAMQLDHRALIVGNTPTGGFAGEVSDGQYKLPGDLTVQIPTGRPVDPVSGETLIEGTGVLPDVRVPVTRDSLLSPADEVLDAAEDALLAE